MILNFSHLIWIAHIKSLVSTSPYFLIVRLLDTQDISNFFALTRYPQISILVTIYKYLNTPAIIHYIEWSTGGKCISYQTKASFKALLNIKAKEENMKITNMFGLIKMEN